jgi:hypothetical protein
MKAEKDYIDFIRLLNYHKVKYLIIGAYVLAFYSIPRNTGDIDFFVKISDENSGNILKVLKEFGFGDINISNKDFQKKGTVIQLGYSPVRTDIMTSISSIDFSDAYINRVKGKIGNLNVFFISKEDLIKNNLKKYYKMIIGKGEE